MRKTARERIKRMLDLCDELEKIRVTIHGVERSGRTRSVTILKKKEERLRDDLSRLKLSGNLGEAVRDYNLDALDVLVLGILLRQYLRSDQPYLGGRHLLRQALHESFDILEHAGRLSEEGPLQVAGLIEAEKDDEDLHPLDRKYKITDKTMTLLQEDMEARDFRRRSRSRKGYSSYAEFMADEKVLVDLHWARSRKLFGWEDWTPPPADKWNPGSGLTRRINRKLKAMKSRLGRTEKSFRNPFLEFTVKHGLSFEEEIITAALLFQELLEGAILLDVVDLIKLVSADQAEVVENRKIFWKRGRLRKHGILVLDFFSPSRILTGDCRLADWVVEELLGEGEEKAITPDEKIDFHLFLEGLRSSKPFFKKMGGKEEA